MLEDPMYARSSIFFGGVSKRQVLPKHNIRFVFTCQARRPRDFMVYYEQGTTKQQEIIACAYTT